MAYLPLANILHYKLRSVLSALGIGMAICMLVTLSGLSRGSLHEIADRWEAVDADLIIFPPGLGDSAFLASGPHVPDAYARILRKECPDLVQHIVPVFARQIKMGGQEQNIAGVDPDDWHVLTGGRGVQHGRVFDPDSKFTRWIERMLLEAGTDAAEPFDPGEAELSHPDHNGLEIVIDTRLARAGGFSLGDVVRKANHNWKIVGLVPQGGLARVYMPRRMAQFLLGDGTLHKSTLMFIKLKEGVDKDEAIDKLVAAAQGAVSGDKGLGRRQTITRKNLVPLANYRGMLVSRFSIMFLYVDVVNAIALIIAFLFIMVTLYTMVLQRQRDIAILKSSGAGDGFILRQVVAESLLLTGTGVVIGTGLSFLAAWAIQTLKPLLTVNLTWGWFGTACLAALAGAVLSALYPAWQATRVDMVQTLTLE